MILGGAGTLAQAYNPRALEAEGENHKTNSHLDRASKVGRET